MGKPEIRFKGYTDEWEQRKLGDIADVTKLAGFEFTEHVVYSDEGNIIALRGLNIKNGQLILDDVKYIDGSNFSKLSRSKLFINDIMFTYVGTVGEVAIIKENDRFYLAPNVSRIRVKSDDSPKFISHYMRTDNFKNKVIFPLIATSSQPALSMENIRKFTINIPINREEQDCLAKYFDSLDHLITLHQRKCDEIKSLKKYMLQKMFPQNEQKVPEIRFKGFTEAWEQRKFSDIVARESSVCTSESDIPSVEYEDVIAEEGRLNKDIRSKEAIKSGIIFDGSQVLYGKLRPYLHNWLNPDFKGVAVGDWWVLKPIVMDKNFLYRLIQTQQFDNIANQSSGSKMPRADWNLISNSKFMVPLSKEEQSKIGRYFDSLDTLITLHQRKSISHPNHPTIHTKHKGEEKYVRIRVNDRGKINRTANLRRFPVDIPGGFKDGGGSVGEFQIYSGAE
ncbi:restriction endonuclease subunit S [Ruminococcus sp. AF24-32LB]|nr:restriction endonuclease subunit S [Ruminococcus sp. AF24-32LB]